MFENAENILRFYEEDIVLHVVKQEVKDKRVYKLLQRGEDEDGGGPADMARIAKSSYLGKNPFGDRQNVEHVEGLEPEQLALLKSLQDRCHTYARVYCEKILNKELQANVAEMEARHAKERTAGVRTRPERIPWAAYRACILMALPKSTHASTNAPSLLLAAACTSPVLKKKSWPPIHTRLLVTALGQASFPLQLGSPS